MKKLLVSIAIASFMGAANAQSAFEGFFGQLGIGYESTNPKFSNGLADGDPYTISNVNNSKGFAGTISIGSYFAVTNSFLLGVGAEYSPLATSNANFNLTIPSDAIDDVDRFKKKNSYNIFLSPALAIDKNKLAYAKVGYTGMSAQLAGDYTANFNFSGYSLGLGYKQIIDGGFYGFAEANYASYGSKTLGDGLSGNMKPNTMNLLVGVGYKF